MLCLFVAVFFVSVTFLQACPEPMNVHIQNYEGPVILHTACDNQQLRNHGNQYKQCGHCDTECTCVSKNTYAPYVYSSSATNVGSGRCPASDAKPLVYCVCNDYGCTGKSNNWAGNPGYGSLDNNLGSGCCPASDAKPLVYCVCNEYGCPAKSNNWSGNSGYGSLETNAGCGCYPASDVKPLVYCVCNECTGKSNNWSGNGYQSYPNSQSKYSGCY